MVMMPPGNAPPQQPPGPAGPGGPLAALLPLLAGAGGGPGPGGAPPDQGGGQDTPDPLEALQRVLQDLHTLVAILPDQQATQVAAQCLAALTKVQSQMMQAGDQAQTAQQAVMQKLGG